MKHRTPVRQYRLQYLKKTKDDGTVISGWVLSYSCSMPTWSICPPYLKTKKEVFLQLTEIDGMSQRQKRKLGQQMADMENGFYDGKYIYFELPPVDRKDHNKIQAYRNRNRKKSTT